MSFTTGLGKSYKEGSLIERVSFGSCCGFKAGCDLIKLHSLKRWFCLKETYIACLDQDNNLCFPMLFDINFECTKGLTTGSFHSIKIKNLQRSLVIKCKNNREKDEWLTCIQETFSSFKNIFHNENHYQSFAPKRSKQLCKWYVNASQYMEHVLAGINAAKEEIFITDWWFSPELYLKRPFTDLQYRLDKVLFKKAVS